MMSHSTFIVLVVALLLISTLSYSSAEKVYCVTPTAVSCSSCPQNSTNCTTLSEYAQEAELYFTSNTTMVFLPGDHILDTNITVANITRLTMCGQFISVSVATVVCNGSVGISFTNMVNFKMHSLVITSCSRSWSYNGHPVNFALHLQSALCIELVNCSFHENMGTAIAVYTTSITLTEINFTQNGCESNSYSCTGGGTSALSSNLTFIGNTTLLENCNGGISAFSSNLIFIGNTTFLENNANQGAAGIYMLNCTMNSTGDINFIHNSNIGSDAGAICAKASSLHFTGTSSFISNSAHIGEGGAIYATASTLLDFSGSSTFSSNSAFSGGAIHTSDNTLLSFNGTSLATQ